MSRTVGCLLLAASLLLSGCGLLAKGTTIQVVNESAQTGSFQSSGPGGIGVGGTLRPCRESGFFLERGTWHLTISVGASRFSDSVTSPAFGEATQRYVILPTGRIEHIAVSSAEPTDASPGAQSPCG
jgi:hypothetical protein